MKNTPNLFSGMGFVGLIISALCLLCGNLLSVRKSGDLSQLCDILRDTFQEYRFATRTLYGERKEEAARDAAEQNKLAQTPVGQCDVFDTALGTTLCYDGVAMRYFRSDIEKIRQAVNRLNTRLKDGKSVTLNDFHEELGLPVMWYGGSVGWNAGKGSMDICYSSQRASDGTPCFVLDYAHNLQPL